MDRQRWVRCAAAGYAVRKMLPPMTMLPGLCTLEFDCYGTERIGSASTASVTLSPWQTTTPPRAGP